MNCKVLGHHHLTDCLLQLTSRWLQFFINSLKIYSLVHITSTILRLNTLRKDIKSKKKSKNPLIILKELQVIFNKFVQGLIRSSCFTSTFALSIPFAACFFNRVLGAGSSYSGLLLGVVFSNGIWFESSSRWGEISLYVLAQWFEGCFKNHWGKIKLIDRYLGKEVAQAIHSKNGSKLFLVSNIFFRFFCFLWFFFFLVIFLMFLKDDIVWIEHRDKFSRELLCR